MSRGPLFQDGYRHQFSGHETFPLRYGWLKKAFDSVIATEGDPDNKSVFTSEDAIARFGVGKNMVAAIRHWATASGIIEDGPGPNSLRTTPLGRRIFGTQGLDPYMEHPATLWLTHWMLSGRTAKTTWFWSFNHFPAVTFEREHLVRGIEKIARDRAWPRVATATIKRDVDCFVRTYVARPPAVNGTHEDTLESPLTELGLIKPIGKRDGFRFVRGPKSTLGHGVFLYALIDFWRGYSSARTLSFEAIAREPGSPGRVFLLDENDVADRLVDLDKVTDGAFRWSETAGLKQILREGDAGPEEMLAFVDLDYDAADRQEAA
ncbi:hypothetical protein CCR83_08415 [Rhodobacter veldkampii DSM 11550]|uniref:DUF4007 domain-containing protein n=1 Tax=Phaeovulum veldkampii DSM 11550 TaxID=1185920 RepID=A0A2T4JAH3_9RHOB|nr:DUF4007 family protein [Phaeovulum veldkampii]MBK5946452.1 hypothetical protein [Phaeovulum veldkampii DSM 11550]PTE14910.1 DUF4007 domain-containing protein [Phaeovulum veldkampii DSM 11550]TDQ53546.1 uncharacterized protein DUF4007 [Phaeovulum veldkampii DSM 11550]